MANMQKMSDVVLWIEANNAFTKAFQKKVLGSTRRMARMPEYSMPLSQIPADLQAFESRWSRGPIRELPKGFKSKASFSDWRSQVKSGLSKFQRIAPPNLVTVEDEWSTAQADLSTAGVDKKRLIELGVLSKIARQEELVPANVSRRWL